MSGYLDNSGREDVLSGGARMIPVGSPAGRYRVWVKRIGNNPGLRVLLLHGGPGATHEYLEACDSYLPAAGIEYYYYDQLGSGFSDQPDEPSLWDLDRFVDEVEQVRQALGLDRDNFVLYGQSWGGILAIEYALHHQDRLRGLVISNMMASVPAYNAYAEQVLMPEMDQGALAEIKSYEESGDIENPRYMELLNEQHYVHHVLRMPVEDWPDPVARAFAHINPAIYVSMQGPSELGISAEASLAHWDRTAELASIEVPALVIGARHDTMDPGHMEMMAGRLPHGRYLYCPDGSHLAMYDDQAVYFAGLTDFLHSLQRCRLSLPISASSRDYATRAALAPGRQQRWSIVAARQAAAYLLWCVCQALDHAAGVRRGAAAMTWERACRAGREPWGTRGRGARRLAALRRRLPRRRRRGCGGRPAGRRRTAGSGGRLG